MDSQTFSFAGVLLYLLLLFVSRVLDERALRALDADQKARLSDAFSKHRIYVLVPVIALAAIGYGVLTYLPGHAIDFLIGEVLCSIALAIGLRLLVLRKVRALTLPEAYVKDYVAARTLVFAGAIILQASIVYPIFSGRGDGAPDPGRRCERFDETWADASAAISELIPKQRPPPSRRR